jgi:hypothetical protein
MGHGSTVGIWIIITLQDIYMLSKIKSQSMTAANDIYEKLHTRNSHYMETISLKSSVLSFFLQTDREISGLRSTFGREFQNVGQATAKARGPNVAVR